MTEYDIIYELPNFWVLRVKNGFEVLQTGITHSIRVAQIGYIGQIGIDKAKAECDKRQNLINKYCSDLIKLRIK